MVKRARYPGSLSKKLVGCIVVAGEVFRFLGADVHLGIVIKLLAVEIKFIEHVNGNKVTVLHFKIFSVFMDFIEQIKIENKGDKK